LSNDHNELTQYHAEVEGMLCKEDIYSWFKDSVSSQRIDLLCSLLQLCLPLELRFVGSCVEEQARKDYCRLIEYEIKANDVAEYELLAVDVDVNGGIQKTLSVYVALLRSSNTLCSLRVFDMLTQLWHCIRSTATRRSASHCHHEQLFDGQVFSDLLLLYTMAAYHPAFSFSQRIKLYHILDDLRKLLHECDFILVWHSGSTSDRGSSGHFEGEGRVYLPEMSVCTARHMNRCRAILQMSGLYYFRPFPAVTTYG